MMAVLLNHTAVRALILAVLLACIAAVTAPAARGSDKVSVQTGSDSPAFSSLTLPVQFTSVCLADEWSWSEFVKFWQHQMGSMTGVVGTVMLVAAAAVLLILYKGKG
jgi:hypothetical protein